MIRVTLLLLLCLCLAGFAADPPDWAMQGILAVETHSKYLAGGRIDYVDKRVGASGERGPFQMTRVAFDQISRPGESFSRLSTDTRFADVKARAYLSWLYNGAAKHDWKVAVAMYHTGPTGYARNRSRGAAYERQVELAAKD